MRIEFCFWNFNGVSWITSNTVAENTIRDDRLGSGNTTHPQMLFILYNTEMSFRKYGYASYEVLHLTKSNFSKPWM